MSDVNKRCRLSIRIVRLEFTAVKLLETLQSLIYACNFEKSRQKDFIIVLKQLGRGRVCGNKRETAINVRRTFLQQRQTTFKSQFISKISYTFTLIEKKIQFLYSVTFRNELLLLAFLCS